jgi:hypothetical protein
MPAGTIARRAVEGGLGSEKVKVVAMANVMRFPEALGDVIVSLEGDKSFRELFCTRTEAEGLRDALTEFLA